MISHPLALHMTSPCVPWYDQLIICNKCEQQHLGQWNWMNTHKIQYGPELSNRRQRWIQCLRSLEPHQLSFSNVHCLHYNGVNTDTVTTKYWITQTGLVVHYKILENTNRFSGPNDFFLGYIVLVNTTYWMCERNLRPFCLNSTFCTC